MISRSRRSRSPLTRVMPPEMTCRALSFPPRPGTVLMPYTMDDDFFDGPGGSLPDCSVAFLSRGSLWSARHPEEEPGIVPAYALPLLCSDPDQTTRTLLSAGVAERARKGGIRILPGKGITITRADGRAAVALTANARRQALHRLPGLKRAVRARDADQCRYCARQVRWGKGRAIDSATWDWVDPLGPASEENVVTACKGCSEAKGSRSPEEAEMILLPEPRNASCNASDLQNNNSPPPRNASKRDSNPYLDRSKDLSPGSKSKSRSKSARTRTRGPAPGSPEFRRRVIAKFAEVAGIAIGPEKADAVTADVLGAREGIDNPLLYVERAIEQDANPVARWLPELAAPPPVARQAGKRRPHCGDRYCNPKTRRRENPETGADEGSCPDCSGTELAWVEAS